MEVAEDELWSSGKELFFVGVGVVHNRGCIGEGVRGYRGCIGGGVVVREDILHPRSVGVGANRAQGRGRAARACLFATAVRPQFAGADGGIIASGRSRGRSRLCGR